MPKRLLNMDLIKAQIQRLYHKSAPMLLFEAVLFAVFGVFMLIQPVGFLSVMVTVFAIILMLIGFYRVVSGLVASQEYGGGWMDVLFGMFDIIIGVLFFAYPIGSFVGVMYLFVVLFIVHSVRSVIFAVNLTRVRFGHYVLNLILALILLTVAISLMFFPLAGAVLGIWIMAILLLVYALADIYMFIQIYRLRDKDYTY